MKENTVEINIQRSRVAIDLINAICPKCSDGQLNYVAGQQLTGPHKKLINHICSNEACKHTMILEQFFPTMEHPKAELEIPLGESIMEKATINKL